MNITIEQIQLVNSQWDTSEIPVSQYSYRRTAFFDMKKWLSERLAISIQGLRRTGKSVLQAQLRDEYLKNNQLEPSRYLFYSFESDEFAKLFPPSMLEELLNLYFLRVLNERAQTLNEPVLICIDEIQNISNWQSVIKKYYDLNPNIKFIVTGSSSLYLEESSESLVGRIMDFIVPPLSFGEFLDLTQDESFPTVKSLEELLAFTPQQIKSERSILFEKFLLVGGFPEAAMMLTRGISIVEIQQYLVKSIISKILTKDLQKYFALEFIEQDLALFRILCNETGSEISYRNISKDVAISEEQVAKHFKTFHKAGLVRTLQKFDTKLRKTISAHPKSYVASPCLAFAYLGHSSIPAGSFIGHIVEGYAYERFVELCKYDEIYFTKPSRNKEIDFYLPGKKILAECKYRSDINTSLLEELRSYGEQFSLKPILLSKDHWGNAEVLGIPVCFL